MESKKTKVNKKNKITLFYKGFFAFLLIILISSPIIAFIFGYKNGELKGYEVKLNFPSITFKKLIDGTFTDELDNYLVQNLPLKDIIIRFRNNILYYVFNISPHAGILAGKDGMLFEDDSVNYFYNKSYYEVSDEYLDETIEKLEKLNNICEESGKKLVLVVTPTKPRYYEDKLPSSIKAICNVFGDESKNRPYERFKEKLDASNISVFDCIEYINEHLDEMDTEDHPLWTKGSYHWTYYQGSKCGIALKDFLVRETEHELPGYYITASRSEVALEPDNDLFRTANVDEPSGPYDEIFVYLNEPVSTCPNFLLRGDSFMDQLIFPFTTMGIDNIVYHIENNLYHKDNYKTLKYIKDYHSYDEVEGLLDDLGKFDIVLIEFNETKIYDFSFGFVDYLLEHKDILSENRVTSNYYDIDQDDSADFEDIYTGGEG